MNECPICDFPATDDLLAILDRIDNPSLIVNLACDFAERVVDLAAHPVENREWLAAVRNWRAYPGANVATVGGVQATDTEVEAAAARAAASAAQAAIWAKAAEEATSMPRYAQVVTQAGFAAAHAALAAGDPKAEAAWQIKHVHRLACACPGPTPPPTGIRSRNSLLAR